MTVFKLKRIFYLLTKMTENALHSLSFFCYLLVLFLLLTIFSFFNLNIKFGKAKQKVITLVATTFKTLLTVSQANGRGFRHKLNTGNIHDLFLNVLVHIFPHQHIKRCATEATHRKTRTPSCRQTNLCADRYYTIKRESHFYQMDSFNGMHKKGIIIP